MNKLLHSLPWTLALALAQAGEGIPTPFPDSTDSLTASESGVFEREGAAPSAPFFVSDSEEAAAASA